MPLLTSLKVLWQVMQCGHALHAVYGNTELQNWDIRNSPLFELLIDVVSEVIRAKNCLHP